MPCPHIPASEIIFTALVDVDAAMVSMFMVQRKRILATLGVRLSDEKAARRAVL